MPVARLGLGRSPDGHPATELKPVFRTDESALARATAFGKARMAPSGTPHWSVNRWVYNQSPENLAFLRVTVALCGKVDARLAASPKKLSS